MVVCILEGWGKFIKQEMPSREYLERAAKIIISATPESSSEERITMKILGDWIDQNENMMSMFLMFEPQEKVEERLSLFLPFKRDSSHLPILLHKYLGKKIIVEKSLKKISKNKDFTRSSLENLKLKKNSSRMSLIKRSIKKRRTRQSQPKLSERITKSYAIPISIENLADPGFYKLKKLENEVSLPNLKGAPATNLINKIKEQQSTEETPKRKSVRHSSLVHQDEKEKNLPTNLGSKRFIPKRTRSKNIITIKDKTIKRKDVILLKEEFDSLYFNNKYSNGMSHSNLPSLSKGEELDPEIAKKVSFKDTLKKFAPGATKEDMDKMLDWVKKEQEIEEKGVINYKMPKYANQQKTSRNIRFKQLKDYIHIFDNLDKDRDSFLTFKDFREAYSHILSDKDIESFFTRFNKIARTDLDHQHDPSSCLDLQEYLKIMLPQDSLLDEKVKIEAEEYHNKLLQSTKAVLRKKLF
ncbi:unnamed protein product [Moneuplotes crassus]|uniref:EF-hand domain-containing protein n=1 Tax=Euplotes crassus TaxID=5936 RepID=A0AAD1U2F8_EUPCR|nr:unnamed protein product [Moneuplotes crassus]